MLKQMICLFTLVIVVGLACRDEDSSTSNRPPGLNLLNSDCPALDIIDVPITEGFAWECTPTEGGNDFIAGTLSGLSMIIDCFSTVSRTDAFCDIEVLAKSSFMANHLEFDLENLPPPEERGCNPEIAISEEEVNCKTIRIDAQP